MVDLLFDVSDQRSITEGMYKACYAGSHLLMNANKVDGIKCNFLVLACNSAKFIEVENGKPKLLTKPTPMYLTDRFYSEESKPNLYWKTKLFASRFGVRKDGKFSLSKLNEMTGVIFYVEVKNRNGFTGIEWSTVEITNEKIEPSKLSELIESIEAKETLTDDDLPF